MTGQKKHPRFMKTVTFNDKPHAPNPTGPQAGGLFKDYCKGQTARTDDAGLLARKIAKDANWPRKVQQFRTLVRYVDRTYGETSVPLLVTLWQESGAQDSPVDWTDVAVRRAVSTRYNRHFAANLRTVMAARPARRGINLAQDD